MSLRKRKGDAYVGGHTIIHASASAPKPPHPKLPTPDLPGGEMRQADFRGRLIARLMSLQRRTPHQESMLRYYLRKEQERAQKESPKQRNSRGAKRS
jgi:hypothetical protein